jgi:hypothetical protein
MVAGGFSSLFQAVLAARPEKTVIVPDLSIKNFA